MHDEPRHRAKRRTTRRHLRRALLSTSLTAMALAMVGGSSPAFVPTGTEAPATPVLGPGPSASSSMPEPTLDDPVDVTASRTTQRSTRAGWRADADRLDDIPHAALAAYQRSAAVMDEASPGSRLHWTLLAAVGRVLTDHGGRGAHRVDDKGHVRPAIIGKPLRARGGHRIGDTEAGLLDGDRRFDRPVGPMLLTPADWTVVGVDGDTDGKRNPQDLDDASLALAVLLCHAGKDLRTVKGKRAALQRIDKTPDFVRAVLDVDTAYRRQLRSDAVQIETVPLTTLPSLPEQLTPPRAKPDRTPAARPSRDSGINPSDGPDFPASEPQPVSTSTDVTVSYDAEDLEISATAVVSADGVAPTGVVSFSLTGPDGVEVVKVTLAGGTASARFAVTDPGSYTVAASYAGTDKHSGSEDRYVVQVVLPPSTEPSADPSVDAAE